MARQNVIDDLVAKLGENKPRFLSENKAKVAKEFATRRSRNRWPTSWWDSLKSSTG